jgi:hypothetical protein
MFFQVYLFHEFQQGSTSIHPVIAVQLLSSSLVTKPMCRLHFVCFGAKAKEIVDLLIQ